MKFAIYDFLSNLAFEKGEMWSEVYFTGYELHYPFVDIYYKSGEGNCGDSLAIVLFNRWVMFEYSESHEEYVRRINEKFERRNR